MSDHYPDCPKCKGLGFTVEGVPCGWVPGDGKLGLASRPDTKAKAKASKAKPKAKPKAKSKKITVVQQAPPPE